MVLAAAIIVMSIVVWVMFKKASAIVAMRRPRQSGAAQCVVMDNTAQLFLCRVTENRATKSAVDLLQDCVAWLCLRQPIWPENYLGGGISPMRWHPAALGTNAVNPAPVAQQFNRHGSAGREVKSKLSLRMRFCIFGSV